MNQFVMRIIYVLRIRRPALERDTLEICRPEHDEQDSKSGIHQCILARDPHRIVLTKQQVPP